MSVRREMRALVVEGLVLAVEALARVEGVDAAGRVGSGLVGVAVDCTGATGPSSTIPGVFAALDESSAAICGFNGVRKGDLNGLCKVRVASSRRRRFAAGVDIEGVISALEG